MARTEFGKDMGLIHEVMVTGRKVGASQSFWAELAHNEELFRKIARQVDPPDERQLLVPEKWSDDFFQASYALVYGTDGNDAIPFTGIHSKRPAPMCGGRLEFVDIPEGKTEGKIREELDRKGLQIATYLELIIGVRHKPEMLDRYAHLYCVSGKGKLIEKSNRGFTSLVDQMCGQHNSTAVVAIRFQM